MLSRFDDYPVHQTPEPLLHSAGNHANQYERYFFHGYARDGSLFFGATLGLYPGRGIIDASFTVVTPDGTQRSVHGSGRLGTDRVPTQVGPILVEVVHPMRSIRLRVDGDELGVVADLLFEARSPAVQEPRHSWQVRSQTVMDSTRMTQFGRWRGALAVDGAAREIDPTATPGVRDRSWGFRPIGDPVPTAPPTTLPHLFWLWAPMHLPDRCLHVAVNEHADGRRWYQSGARIGELPADPTDEELVATDAVAPWHGVDWDIEWEPGTRRAARATWTLSSGRGGAVRVEMRPMFTVLMRGMGYTDPDWGHGRWHGEAATATRSWSVPAEDPTEVWNLHVQQVCEVVAEGPDGRQQGVGVLEILPLGEHQPSGLTGFSDGWTG